MAEKSGGTGARLIILVVVLLAAGGAFLYMQTRGPSADDIEYSLQSGELWGQPLAKATEVFGIEPTSIPREPTDSPSAERWLYKIEGNPPTYYLIFVQNDVITQAQPADAQGNVLPR